MPFRLRTTGMPVSLTGKIDPSKRPRRCMAYIDYRWSRRTGALASCCNQSLEREGSFLLPWTIFYHHSHKNMAQTS